METRRAPCGLQDVLNRLAFVALANKPVCFYKCFSEALDRDIVHRTLLEIQAEKCKCYTNLSSHLITLHMRNESVLNL